MKTEKKSLVEIVVMIIIFTISILLAIGTTGAAVEWWINVLGIG